MEGADTSATRLKAGLLAAALLTAEIVLPPLLLDAPATRATAAPERPAVRALEGCDRRISAAVGRPTGDWERITLPRATTCATFSAKVAAAGRVAVDSAFTLSTAEPMTAAQARERLSVSPKADITVRALSDEPARRFEVKPKRTLARGKTYRVSFAGADDRAAERWAFTTDAPLRVVSTLPRNEATEVPLNTGIEITFSHDDVEGAQERFVISPSAKGRFETHGRTLVFVPRALEQGRVYTVRLRPGATSGKHRLASETRFVFETARTDERASRLLSFVRRVWETRPSARPVIGAFSLSGEGKLPSKVPIEVYRYASAEAFAAALSAFEAAPLWTHHQYEERAVSAAGLTKVMSFEAKPVPVTSSPNEFTITFPRALRAGSYLVRAASGRGHVHSFMQSTDLAAYSVLSERRALVWINDLATGGPVQAAKVSLAGRTLGTTGADGVASFEPPRALAPDRATGRAPALVVGDAAGRKIVVPQSPGGGGRGPEIYAADVIGPPGYSPGDTAFWRYVAADRSLYKPTDTVRLWGLVRPREGARRARPLDLVLQGGDDNAEISRKRVTTSASGTFITEMALDELSPGGYAINISSAGTPVSSTWFSIEDYTKPAYGLDVTATPRALIRGEPAVYQVEAAFFEGTPVPGLTLRYTSTKEGRATTDDAGKARISLPTASAEIYGPEGSIGIDVGAVKAEEGDISASAHTRVFPSALTLDAEAEVVRSTARMTGRVHHLDLAAINSGDEDSYDDYRGKAAAGREVTAEVTRTTYTQVEDGEYYDYISKRTEKRYRYDSKVEQVGTFTATTDAKGRFTIRYPADDDASYEALVTVKDDRGRATEARVHAQSGLFSFDGQPHIVAPDRTYAVGEKAVVEARLPDGTAPTGPKHRYLFHVSHLGLRSHEVREAPAFTVTFSADHVPNLEVGGVLFDGERLRSFPATTLVFDHLTRELDVEVTPRGGRRAPGAKVPIDVRVTDRTGRPREAEVLLSAVDEAFYRLQGEGYFGERDALASLYGWVSTSNTGGYESHRGVTPAAAEAGKSADAGGGAGTGGAAGPRTDFRDVGLFERVRTGADGRATVSFDLPDNLTSWRVNAIAVSDDLFAGTSVASVEVGLPVFIDVGLNPSYLTSDEPSVRVRAFGSALREGSPVRFTVRAPTLSEEPVVASGTAFEPADIALPALREGRHRVVVQVRAGDQVDEVERTIVVVPSRIMQGVSRFAEITTRGGRIPEGAPGRPVRLILADHNRGRYHAATQALAWTYGDRLDQVIARLTGQDLLAEQFGEPRVPLPEELRATAYQTPRGGLAILTYSDDDLGLTARLATLAPERFDRARMKRYLRSVFDDPDETRERVLLALWGLAALGEPVLSDLAQAAEQDLPPMQRLVVGMAASAAGDDATARQAFRDAVSAAGERRGHQARISTGRGEDDIAEATALAAWLGARLSEDLAPSLFAYASESAPEDLLIVLETAGFLQSALPALERSKVRFSYEVDGTRTERTLEPGESLTLRLSASQREALRIDVAEGRLGVVASSELPARISEMERDPELSLARRYGGREGSVSLRDGDLVKVSLTVRFGGRALRGCTQVSDLLPSGLRPVTALGSRAAAEATEGRSEEIWHPYSIVGQRVSFCVYRGKEPVETISYFARVTGVGTFTAEPAMASSQRDPSRVAATPSTDVAIS